MRYQKRWANGFWRLFDTVNYTTAFIYGTSADADNAVAKANASK